MLVKKNISLKDMIAFSWFHMVWLPLWATFMALVYEYFKVDWMMIP